MTLAARTPSQRDKLRDEILDQLPWPTPEGQIDWAFASQAAAAPGGLAEQIACWLRRVGVPAGLVLLVVVILQILTS